MPWWGYVLVYFFMMVVTARMANFARPQPGDKFFAGLIWPIIWSMVVWNLLTGQMQFKFNGRVVYRGRHYNGR